MSTHSTTHRTDPAIPISQKDTRWEPPEAHSGDGFPDMALVCRILAGQVVVLDAMFRQARELACQEERATETYERLSRLALRAQSQTSRTAAVLRHLCPPPPVEPETDPDEEDFLNAMRDHRCKAPQRTPAPRTAERAATNSKPGTRNQEPGTHRPLATPSIPSTEATTNSTVGPISGDHSTA